MSASNYRRCLSLVLAHEGGYVNHPRDPGGATNRGVTQRVYDGWRQMSGAPKRGVQHITDDEVADIYKRQYWRLVRGDDLPAGIDYMVFDFGVNSGVSRAVRYLQRQVGLEDDGVIGVVTLTAVYEAAKKDEEKFIAEYCANRMAFLRSLDIWPTFGKGWTRRVVGYQSGIQAADSGVLDYSIAMAREDKTYSLARAEQAHLFVMPQPVGALPGEANAKAASPDRESLPTRPLSYQELKAGRWAQ